MGENFNTTILNSKNGAIRFMSPEKYQILRILNEGAQGIVVEAWDQLNARKLAIKKLKNIFENPGGPKLWYREFVLGAAVQHDNPQAYLFLK
uniref:Serine/threonine protein kinase n=1 Tax=Panagrolaimus davidi TaxID=227884 RepID=A0A914PYD8_9BILA